MKALILLPLFALLPFLAFPSGVPEITQDEKENTIENTENESLAYCTASTSKKIISPQGSLTISCIIVEETCKEAIEKAYACIGEVPPTEN